ncbi:uncharacterized protein LOC108109930 [Drosophila eugracilis]|uniref:uncharacterized protein LOC108109930 n=1 Tax=Drosophila eugracilis TaxID=29029 RepID=UPI0007E6CA9E|nr:uncharacterized protein LOC108109930 [Drosophila eugracilis]
MPNFTVAAGLLVCLIIILGGQGALAGISRVKLTNPTYPGRCVLDGYTTMMPGQIRKVPNVPCASVKCDSDLYATFTNCPIVDPPKGCKQRDFVNPNRDFPACCERKYECKAKN